jgi:hypothetical protein
MSNLSGLTGVGYLFAQETGQTSDLLDVAEEKYFNGDFDQAIDLANQVLNSTGISSTDQQRAYIIFAKIYLALEQTDSAKNYVLKILDLDPLYQPTIEQETPQFVNFVAQVRRDTGGTVKKKKKNNILMWVATGAGAVITVAVLTVMASGTSSEEKETDNTLPEPPAFP